MSVALRGYYEASCAVLAAPVGDVEAMLGHNNLVLDPVQTLAPPGMHPFVILMGAHRDVEVKFVPGTSKYREALVAVPWVRHKGKACGAGPLAYNEHLWLDRLMVVLGGWLWGFPKIWSRVSIESVTDTDQSIGTTKGNLGRCDAYSVHSLIGNRPILGARFKEHGAAGPPASFPNFPPVRPVFEQMFIQRFLLVGPTILSKLTFELDQATMQAIDAEIDYQGRKYRAPGLDATPLGAFRLSLPWTLSWPTFCKSGEEL